MTAGWMGPLKMAALLSTTLPYPPPPCNLQVDALMATVAILKVQPNDIMLTGDADEIPTAAAVLQGRNYMENNVASIAKNSTTIPMVEFELKHYYCNFYHATVRG